MSEKLSIFVEKSSTVVFYGWIKLSMIPVKI